MIYKAFMFKYPGFIKIELVCGAFDKAFTANLYSQGWQYLRGSGIFYKTFKPKVETATEKLLETLDFVKKNKITLESIDLTKGFV